MKYLVIIWHILVLWSGGALIGAIGQHHLDGWSYPFVTLVMAVTFGWWYGTNVLGPALRRYS